MQKLDFMVSLIDKVSAPAGKMMNTVNKVTSRMQKGFQKVAIGSASLIGVGFAIDRLTAKAVRFESVMADVNKTVDFKTPKDFKLFANDILAMTKILPITAQGLGEIAAAGGRLGLKQIELPDFINVTAKMATAFDLQTEQAGDAAATLSNIYNIPIHKLSLLGDVINHLSDNTAAKAGDIIDVLQRVGGTGQLIGLSTNKIAALAASMLELGFPAEQAGTSINAMFLKLNNLQSAGPKVQKALAGMGLSSQRFANDLLASPQQAINTFLTKINGLGDAQASNTLATIFGLEHTPKIALLAKQFEKYSHNIGLVADQSKFLGSMEKEFQIRANTTANKIVLMSNAWERFMINLGNLMLPTVISGISLFSNILDPISAKMSRWSELFPTLSSHLGTVMGVVFGLIAVVALFSIGLGIATAMAGGFALVLTIVTSPITLVIIAIAALSAVVISVVKHWDEWSGVILHVGKAITDALGITDILIGFSAFLTRIYDGWSLIFSIINDNSGSILSFITDVVLAITGIVDSLARALGFGPLLDGIAQVFKMIIDGWKMIAKLVLPDWLQKMGGNITVDSVQNKLSGAWDWMTGTETPKSIKAPASFAPKFDTKNAQGGVINRISNATNNNSKSMGDVHVNNYGTPMNGQVLINEMAFAAG